jgi:hypothetical protein
MNRKLSIKVDAIALLNKDVHKRYTSRVVRQVFGVEEYLPELGHEENIKHDSLV